MTADTISLQAGDLRDAGVDNSNTRWGTRTRTLRFTVPRALAFPEGLGNLRAPYLRIEPRTHPLGGLWNIATLTVESPAPNRQVLRITAVSEEAGASDAADETMAAGMAAADAAAAPRNRRPVLTGQAELMPARRNRRGTRGDAEAPREAEPADPADALAARLTTHNEPVDLGLVRFVSESGPCELTCEYLPGRDGALGRVRINTGNGAFIEVALRPFLNTLIQADTISQRPVTDTRRRRTLSG